ncbi:MAG: UDP-N-acetylglucosamine 2-epimerase (non-hydrolyzing) [Flavobacteriales bacterium]
MKTILTVIGARPQIIKASAISRAIKESFSGELKEILLHTGQHYDTAMSQIFIDQLGIPEPDINLNTGSRSHGKQTAFMLEGIEEQLDIHKPDGLLVYGDTNSTLAAALAASKIHIPVVHVEAGLRSFNKRMPEEINRIGCDHVSTMLFSPSTTGMENLKNENFKLNAEPPFTIDTPAVYHSGDVMYDNSFYFSKESEEKSTILDDLGLRGKDFILSTIHRPSNTDSKERLEGLMETLLEIAEGNRTSLILTLHPRTKAKLEQFFSGDTLMDRLENSEYFRFVPPCGFLDIIALEKNCSMVMSDSGGVQKEAYFFGKPCLVFRPQTEWIEIIHSGCARLVDADPTKIKEGYEYFKNNTHLEFPSLFGDGKAAHFICEQIVKHL